MDEPKVKVETKEEAKLVNDKITITIQLERIFDPNRKKNNLMMTMESATFADPKTDDVVGEVLHGVPSHSVIRDKETGEDWVLNYGDLFTAYKKAREDLKKEDDIGN
jgi:hypothetical protein